MVIREQTDHIFRNLILAHLNLIPLFSFDLFLLALSGDVVQSAFVPVPLGHLVHCHADLLRYLHLLGVRPDGLIVELLAEDLHLPLFLTHAVALTPIRHVFLILFLSNLRQGLRVHFLKGPLASLLRRAGCILVVLEGHVTLQAGEGATLFARLTRHGSGEHFLLLANLFGSSLDLGCARDDRGFAAHVDSTPTAANLHLVVIVHGGAEAEDAIILHHVLIHDHVVLVLYVNGISQFFGVLRDCKVAIDTHLTCTAARHECRWLGVTHGTQWVEDRTLLHQVCWLH